MCLENVNIPAKNECLFYSSPEKANIKETNLEKEQRTKPHIPPVHPSCRATTPI